MHIRALIVLIFMAVYLTGCATSKRGAKQEFFIRTTPAGAKVETSIHSGKAVKLSQGAYDSIQSGERPAPDLKFMSCEPTPCGFELPRKIEFDVLVSKAGYKSQTFKIDHFHRKEIAKEVQREVNRNTAIAGAGAAVLGAGAIAVGTQAISTVATLGTATATASTGAMVGAAAIAATPVLGIGLISMGVDSSTGANYDYWPNPIVTDLEPNSTAQEADNIVIYEEFDAMRRNRIIRPRLSAAEMRSIKKITQADRQERLENDRLFKDYLENPTPERTKKPQSERAQRRLEKRQKLDAERKARNKDKVEDKAE